MKKTLFYFSLFCLVATAMPHAAQAATHCSWNSGVCAISRPTENPPCIRATISLAECKKLCRTYGGTLDAATAKQTSCTAEDISATAPLSVIRIK